MHTADDATTLDGMKSGHAIIVIAAILTALLLSMRATTADAAECLHTPPASSAEPKANLNALRKPIARELCQAVRSASKRYACAAAGLSSKPRPRSQTANRSIGAFHATQTLAETMRAVSWSTLCYREKRGSGTCSRLWFARRTSPTSPGPRTLGPPAQSSRIRNDSRGLRPVAPIKSGACSVDVMRCWVGLTRARSTRTFCRSRSVL